MARSTYVYIVRLRDGCATLVAFTVKHELITWLKVRPHLRDRIQVMRLRDGVGGVSAFITPDIEKEAFA